MRYSLQGLAIGTVTWATFAVASSTKTTAKIIAEQRLVIGYGRTTCPFSFKNASRVADCYLVDVCKRTADRIKTKPKQPQLYVDFREVASQDRNRAGICFAVRQSSKIIVTNAPRGRVTTTGKNNTAERLRKVEESRLRFKSIVSAPSSPKTFKLLESGAVVAVFTDKPLLLSYIAKSKSLDAYLVAGKYLSVEPYGLLLCKDDVSFN